ncbi:MAG: cardiolipin synthase [Thermoanaerobaculia bacterium]
MTKTPRRVVPLWVVIVLLALVVIFGLLLWSTKLRQDTRLRAMNPGELGVMIPSIVSLAQGTIDDGNDVRVLQNGAYFDALLADVAGANETIHFETYVWWTGEICGQLAAALAERARAGVEVRVLLDASGSSRMDDEVLATMEDAGCKVAKFHPLRISNLGRLNNRDHRKIAVIDGRIGFLGGHGVAQEWTGNAENRDRWRDTAVRVEGPVVARLQAAFAENWIEETGEVTAGERYFPRVTQRGSTPAHIAYTSPTGSVSSVQLLYYLAITAARKELIIQNPYFLPDDDAIEAIAAAVRRGVRVIVMMPADSATDSPLVQHASHQLYETLLGHGVRIFEYQKTLLHQKVLIVDGVWSCIGSTNFDDRSFELNDEISMGVIDERVAGELRAAFEDDLRHSREWKLADWKKRSLTHRVKDRFAFLFNEQL